MLTWFLEIALVSESECVRVVCVSAPEGINNQWHDIDRAWLVKQVLRLFRFSVALWHLPSGAALVTQQHSTSWTPDKKIKVTRY